MTRSRWFLGIALAASLSAGCVERRFVVISDPPGALVLRSGQPMGAAPADDHFVYYGTYHFTLIKDGYATLQVDQPVPAPWYEYFPLEFFTENLWPFHIVDRREFTYKLEPVQAVRTDELLHQADVIRAEGKSIGKPPVPPPPPPAGPPPAVVPGPGAPPGIPPAPASGSAVIPPTN